MKNYVITTLLLLTGLASCSTKEVTQVPNPDIPIDVPRDSVPLKPVQIWVDAEANFTRLATKEAISTYLKKMKETGFTEVYLDVKPGIGHALYQSDILPPLTKWGENSVERDWDYLAYWIQEAERLDLSIIASLSVMGYGYTKTKEGLVYQDDQWDGKTQYALPDPTRPEMLIDIRDQQRADAAMLNPSLPEVQQFVRSVIDEIATKYPKLKGICLDYCRWYGGEYGFSASTLNAFQDYSGKTISSRNEILTQTGGMGPLFSEWIEFRSMTITRLITDIRSSLRTINPELELHLWASADWASRYSVGQNWASKNYKPSGEAYTSGYSKTGFADQIDVFSLGAYSESVWKSENPESVWSVENFVTSYSTLIQDECQVYGSFASYAYESNSQQLSDAVYLCLKNTDGVMAFELSHIINFNQWAAIKEGIQRIYP